MPARLVNHPAGRTHRIGSIAAHPCQKRKDGAPSVEMVRAKAVIKGGPPASSNQYLA